VRQCRKLAKASKNTLMVCKEDILTSRSSNLELREKVQHGLNCVRMEAQTRIGPDEFRNLEYKVNTLMSKQTSQKYLAIEGSLKNDVNDINKKMLYLTQGANTLLKDNQVLNSEIAELKSRLDLTCQGQAGVVTLRNDLQDLWDITSRLQSEIVSVSKLETIHYKDSDWDVLSRSGLYDQVLLKIKKSELENILQSQINIDLGFSDEWGIIPHQVRDYQTLVNLLKTRNSGTKISYIRNSGFLAYALDSNALYEISYNIGRIDDLTGSTMKQFFQLIIG